MKALMQLTMWGLRHWPKEWTPSASAGVGKWLIVVGVSVAFALAGTMPANDGSAPFILTMPAAGSHYDIVPSEGPKEKGLRKPQLLSIRPYNPQEELEKQRKSARKK